MKVDAQLFDESMAYGCRLGFCQCFLEHRPTKHFRSRQTLGTRPAGNASVSTMLKRDQALKAPPTGHFVSFLRRAGNSKLRDLLRPRRQWRMSWSTSAVMTARSTPCRLTP